MPSIRKIPLIISGCQRGNTSPLIVFGKDSSSMAASDVDYVIAINTDGYQIELASIDSPDSLEESPHSGRPELCNHSLSQAIILVRNKNRPTFLLTVPHPPTMKKDRVAPEEGHTIAKDPDASGSPGMPCQDPGWRDRGVRRREAGHLTQV
ncbi:hypothetical protein HPB50_029198 [Hyalomma asiaticum]|nr:hypothetical protein HPB50_029198 [Hyalomma asiaticum]